MIPPKRIFVCQIVPNDKVTSLPNISQAGNNFCYRFIHIAKPGKIFSMIPVNISNKEQFNFKLPHEVIQIQVRFFPHKFFLKLINALFENILVVLKLFKFNKETPIWYYNLTSYNLISVLILKYLFNRKIYFIIADYQPPKRKFSIENLIFIAIKKSVGLISLSTNFLKNEKKNLVSLSGIVEKQTISLPKSLAKSNKFLFSGALTEYAGINLALEVFAQNPELQLYITGNGALLDQVKKYSQTYNNIHYLGFLDYDKYLEFLPLVSICLSLRNPDYEFNMYNFPSKLLEFMSYGKLVLSTLRYDAIDKNIYIYSDYNFDSLNKSIQQVSKMSNEYYINLTEQAKSFVFDNFSEERWRNVISALESNKYE